MENNSRLISTTGEGWEKEGDIRSTIYVHYSIHKRRIRRKYARVDLHVFAKKICEWNVKMGRKLRYLMEIFKNRLTTKISAEFSWLGELSASTTSNNLKIETVHTH